MHSPSPLLIGIGTQLGGDVTTGLQRSSGRVAAAAGGVGGTAAASVASGGAQSGGKAGGKSVTVNVAAGAIVVQGAAGASALELTESAIGLLFERIALEKGLAA
jgi:hypothetical protein